ncbi:hypothetical protein G3I15_00890, partial [Streptomyces sp. SID10244]|nr:hypothetical protein [Streptomyces sp. SID10244]
MPGARWFPGARINYAEHALRHHGTEDGPETAIIAEDETGTTSEVTWDELRGMVGSLQRWLRAQG